MKEQDKQHVIRNRVIPETSGCFKNINHTKFTWRRWHIELTEYEESRGYVEAEKSRGYVEAEKSQEYVEAEKSQEYVEAEKSQEYVEAEKSQEYVEAEKSREDTENIWQRLQAYLRRRRFHFIRQLLIDLPSAYQLLDVGGTPEFWQQMNFSPENGNIVLYNLIKTTTIPAQTRMTSISGDACDMHIFADKCFDIVFSNSVIEHVGTYRRQQQMAQEIQRVGQRYCVQTPNRYFPIEPHVLWPCFQFLPQSWQVYILLHIRSPWGWKITTREEAERYVRNIRLLSEKELHILFPGTHIYREKFLGLTKSFLVYNGW
jgi:hypothetical protein